jgi:hypothetical protein
LPDRLPLITEEQTSRKSSHCPAGEACKTCYVGSFHLSWLSQPRKGPAEPLWVPMSISNSNNRPSPVGQPLTLCDQPTGLREMPEKRFAVLTVDLNEGRRNWSQSTAGTS